MGIYQRQRRENLTKSLRFFLGRQKCDSQENGFTLLEIIAISVMVGILAAVATPSFFGYLNRQRLNAVQQQILDELRRAQSEARRRQETYQFSLATVTEGTDEFIAIAVHPAEIADDEGTCVPDPAGPNGNVYQVLRSTDEIALDAANSTIGNGVGICNAAPEVRQRFNRRGEAIDGGVSLGRVTLQLDIAPETRRCVFVSTILGALRTDNDDGCQ